VPVPRDPDPVISPPAGHLPQRQSLPHLQSVQVQVGLQRSASLV
jgi:hypothetical protein